MTSTSSTPHPMPERSGLEPARKPYTAKSQHVGPVTQKLHASRGGPWHHTGTVPEFLRKSARFRWRRACPSRSAGRLTRHSAWDDNDMKRSRSEARVLVIDGTPGARAQLTKYLKAEGYTVTAADAARPSLSKNPHAAALGRLGGLKGGPARANSLSPRKRRAIARKAARARWSARRP